MKSSNEKPSPSGEKKNSTGKKLVQARLPFKLISSPICTEAQTKLEPRKQKLAYSDEDLNSKNSTRKPGSKDNESSTIVFSGHEHNVLEDSPVQQSNTKLTMEFDLSPVVKLQNIDHIMHELKQNEDGTVTLPKQMPQKTVNSSVGNSVQNKEKEMLKIKLPLSHKKKRKLSKQNESGHSNDNEIIEIDLPSNKLNPLKRPKFGSDDNIDILKDSREDDLKIQVIDLSSEKSENIKRKSDIKKWINSTKQLESNDKIEKDTAIGEGSSRECEGESDEYVIENESECSSRNSTYDKNENNSIKKMLIVKQLKDSKEIDKKRDEKQKAKEEKEKKIQEEKLQRQREKEEKELQRKREKEEKEELRRKEKEEKEKKRLAEIEAKSEERRIKEDERKKREEVKEEEKRKREDERRKKELEKEEAENKKKKAAEAFTKFFFSKKTPSKKCEQNQNVLENCNEVLQKTNFMPFQIKGDMKLAPIQRRILDTDRRKYFEQLVLEQIRDKSISKDKLYLQSLKSGNILPGKDSRTWLKENDVNCLIIVDDELEGAGQSIDDISNPMQTFRAKFFSFHENQRPPYYGTWRKRSQSISGRRPFIKDTNFCEYEIDSDDEWEEEEPGESLNGSEDEKESEDEYEVDNDFFVPHGHLSDEELQNEDEQGENNSPEIQKAKLKILQQEFAKEMKKKTEKIKPRLVGIVWQDINGNQPENCPSVIWQSLNKRAMIYSEPIVFAEQEKSENAFSVSEKKNQKRTKLTEDLIKDLIRLVHGNRHNKQFLIKEFQAYLTKKFKSDPSAAEYTKVSIRNKIDKIAEWKLAQNEVRKKNYLCWIVTSDALKRYEMEECGIVNNWNYILKPNRHSIENSGSLAEMETELILPVSKTKAISDITKFAKVLPKETKEQDTSSISSLSSKENSHVENEKGSTVHVILNTVKKRVPILMSVPRGQDIPQQTKDAFISNYLRNEEISKQNAASSSEKNENIHNEKITKSSETIILIE